MASSSNLAGIPAQGVGSLSTLLKRLEAATARLEDIAIAQAPGPHLPSGASALHGATLASPAATTAPSSAQDNLPAVLGFQELCEGPLAVYVAASNEIGNLVAQQATAVAAAFRAQGEFIKVASTHAKLSPTSPHFASLLAPTQSALMAALEIKESNRPSKGINQLSTVSEGIPALGWVTLDNKPGPFVGDMKESAQFYANRVVKDNKESDPKQAEWARSFMLLLEELRKYIMQYHAAGLSWNAKGPAYNSSAAKPSAPSTNNSSAAQSPVQKTGSPAGDMSGMFAALNKGEGVTSGLKKVDKSEMTHKNPELRGTGVVGGAGAAVSKPTKPPKPTTIQRKPPVTQLDGNKWIIENHENNPSIVIEQTEINQIINVFDVKASVIQIKGKVNAISLVNCTKVSLLLESTVSSLSISASPSFTVQILGRVPTILIDGTDCGQIYLSKESLDVEIITSKASSINISVPVEGEEEGIFEEKAVPEQMKTVVRDGKLVTVVMEHSS